METIKFIAREIKTNNPVLIEGKELTKEMSLAEANAYYKQISVNKPSQSYFAPALDSGYIYDKATNSLIKNETVAVETSSKKVATKTTEPTV